jgi:hypothetical protein
LAIEWIPRTGQVPGNSLGVRETFVRA